MSHDYVPLTDAELAELAKCTQAIRARKATKSQKLRFMVLHNRKEQDDMMAALLQQPMSQEVVRK